MLPIGLLLLSVAALIHFYIFTMETLTWTSKRTRNVFGTNLEQAEETKVMAANQGIYNLMLALVMMAGVLNLGVGAIDTGRALVLASGGSMIVAGLYLAVTQRTMRSAARAQYLPPLAGLFLVLFSL